MIVTAIASSGLTRPPATPSVDVIEAVALELEYPSALVVGHIQHLTHVRIRDTVLVYAALQYQRCFEGLLGRPNGHAWVGVTATTPISAGQCPFLEASVEP
jgi:hypothetical protein